jgi:hypothetical protein
MNVLGIANILGGPADGKTELLSSRYVEQNLADLASKVPATARYDVSSDIGFRNWSSSYPYELVVLQAGPGSYSVFSDSIFSLPINPEELSNAMPFASSVAATLDGVVEQNGGAPFRQISFSGTFGVHPLRKSGESLQGGLLHELGGLFGGTISAVTRTIASARQVVLGPEFKVNVDNEIDPRESGYAQFRILQRYLESYAEVKKTTSGRDLRLALLIWKEQAAYLVTPQAFRVSRSAGSPFEYRYSLQFQAWKRIDPSKIGAVEPQELAWRSAKPRDASIFSQIMGRLNALHNTLQGLSSIITGIEQDFDSTVMGPIREVGLLIKDVGGFVTTLSDFKNVIQQEWYKGINSFGDSANSLAAILRKDSTAPSNQNFGQLGPNPPGLGPPDVLRGTTGTDQSINEDLDQARNDAGNGSATAAEIMANMNPATRDAINSMIDARTAPQNSKVKKMIEEELKEVRKLTAADFRKFQQQILDTLAKYAAKVGLGSDTFNTCMRSPGAEPASQDKGQHGDTIVSGTNTTTTTTVVQQREPMDEDLEVLAALMEAAQVMGQMATLAQTVRNPPKLTIDYVAGVANQAQIAMRVPKSKFAVPYTYGGSLERMAQQYLGDSQRWFEIAALNDLRQPYIDETGTTASLLINGRGNQIALADASSLVLGQSIHIFSDIRRVEVRTVRNVRQDGPSMWMVTLDGDADLDLWKVTENAKARWWAPHTVHSGQVLYIPSDDTSQINQPYSPNESDLAKILEAGDIDGALTERGDIAIQPDGNWPFCYGLESLIQWTRIALSTPRGAMMLHPGFGVDLPVGSSLADVSAKDLMAGLRGTFQNKNLTGIRSASVKIDGPVARVGLELGVRGSDVLIPVSFDMSR